MVQINYEIPQNLDKNAKRVQYLAKEEKEAKRQNGFCNRVHCSIFGNRNKMSQTNNR